MIKKRCSKKHPLWPVYDLQRQIVKRGGIVNRHSDLLAYFEGKSLELEKDAQYYLINLAENNNQIKKVRELIEVQPIVFWSQQKYDSLKNAGLGVQSLASGMYPKTKRLINEKTLKDFFDGYSYLPYKELKEDERKTLENNQCKDNEISYRRRNLSYTIVINSKYTDILRFVKNGYNAEKENMDRNRNLIPAIILAVGLIIAAFIYAFAHRYEIRNNYLRIDKWTGTMQRIEPKK